jgi:ACR3 family arsenite efflux pump ArsB
MQNPSRVSLVKRVLFPYSGEDPLSFWQGLRVVLTWVIWFVLPLLLFVLGLAQLEHFSLQRTLSSLMLAFLSGAGVFGLLSLLIVVMSNRAARIRQAWKARNNRSL